MSQRILFMTFSDFDFLHPIKYDEPRKINIGDVVYTCPGISYFFSSKLNVTFVGRLQVMQYLASNPNWAKEKFDLCIRMAANTFGVRNKQLMLEQARLFNTLGIPVYTIGIGVQTTVDFDETFIGEIEECSKILLDTIIYIFTDMIYGYRSLWFEFSAHKNLENSGLTLIFG